MATPTQQDIIMQDGSRAKLQTYAAKQPKAVMLVVHGFAEYLARYGKLADYFCARGISVCIYDQRSFGETAFNKKRGRFALDYASFLDDLDEIYAIVADQHKDLPLILFGHSMGGNISLSYLYSRPQSRFCMAILETPWLRLHIPVENLLMSLAPRLGRNYAVNANTAGKYKTRQLRRPGGRLPLIASIAEAGEQAIPRAAEIKIPTLLLSADRDGQVSTPAIEEFYSHANGCIEYRRIIGRHALHSEKAGIREYTFSTMLGFIEHNLPADQEVLMEN